MTERIRLGAVLDGPLARLIDKRVLSPANATREMDGRLVPFVVARVVDQQRRPVGGMPLELRDAGGNLVDATTSSAGGLGILRFPARRPRPLRADREETANRNLADGGDVVGTVHLLDGSAAPPSESVRIPPHQQQAKVLFSIGSPSAGVLVQLPPGDDPLARLPVDFTEEVCKELLAERTDGSLIPSKLAPEALPFSPPVGAQTALASQRVPLIRRFDVVRFGETERFLVRLRQEWVLLTYTLGELANVKALDPGAIVQSAEQLVRGVSSTARQALDITRSTVSQTLNEALSELGSIDAVVTTIANANAAVPNLAAFLHPTGGDLTLTGHLDLTVSTDVNTSLLVNRAVQQVSALVNEVIAKVQTVAEQTQRTTSDVVNHLAPLISQVANALHWRVYEVYAVCTNVEAVHPILELEVIASLPDFTDEDVRVYRPFLESALLDRTLASAFDTLVSSAELPPLIAATVEVTYDANFSAQNRVVGIPIGQPESVDAILNLSLGGVTTSAKVQNGTDLTVTLPTVRFPVPVGRGCPLAAKVTIGSEPGPFGLPVEGAGIIKRVQIWVDQPLSGAGLIPPISNTGDFQVPVAPAATPIAQVLLRHVNRHRHYYYGVLAESAIRVPSLRRDAAQLLGINPILFRLPLLGMEGTTALLVDEAIDLNASPPPSAEVQALLDDFGAGTLVQILAPGAYGEILTGLLQIPVSTLHPLLEQASTGTPFGQFPNLPTGSATSGG